MISFKFLSQNKYMNKVHIKLYTNDIKNIPKIFYFWVNIIEISIEIALESIRIKKLRIIVWLIYLDNKKKDIIIQGIKIKKFMINKKLLSSSSWYTKSKIRNNNVNNIITNANKMQIFLELYNKELNLK